MIRCWDTTGAASIAIVQAQRGGEEFQAPPARPACPICGQGTEGGHRHQERATKQIKKFLSGRGKRGYDERGRGSRSKRRN